MDPGSPLRFGRDDAEPPSARAGRARRPPLHASIGVGEFGLRVARIVEGVDVLHPGLDRLALGVALHRLERLRPEARVALDRGTELAVDDGLERILLAV